MQIEEWILILAWGSWGLSLGFGFGFGDLKERGKVGFEGEGGGIGLGLNKNLVLGWILSGFGGFALIDFMRIDIIF